MTLPQARYQDLARLAVAALVDDDLTRLHTQIVGLAKQLPGAVAAALFDMASDGEAHRLASIGWDGRTEQDVEVPAVVRWLPAATGLDDTRLAAREGEREVLTVGREGAEVHMLVAVFADASGTSEAAALLADAAQIAATAARRRSVHQDLEESQRRFSEAQQLGRMGSYDWHIASDTNVWSDELYRIYGTEPQSFNASYERFLEFVHPDDRERIKAVHAEAYANGGSYQMEERIVRPDGDVRTLETTGQVVMGPDGTPARMVGVCLDVTERRRAEHEARLQARRFAALIAATPDAVLLVDDDGTIVEANPQTVELFGYERDELIGSHVDRLLPEAMRTSHAAHRARFHADPHPRTMAAGRDLFARRADGTEVPVDVSLGVIELDGRTSVAAFVRDATERRHLTALALALHDAAARRRQALEINDGVVQGLASVIYTLEAGQPDLALDAARRTVQGARSMMNDLMEDSDGEGPSSFRRDAAPVSVLGGVADDMPAPPPATPPQDQDTVRVMIVDDADDLRMLLKITVSSRVRFEVVGEAADGAEALEVASEVRPDIILLDLAMPVMDGFEALPQLRAMLPEAAIIVLSGFDADRMERRALELGADRYVEKGAPSARLLALLDELSPGGPSETHAAPALPPDPTEFDAGEFGMAKLSHELRTPLTVIRSMIDTLHDQMDALPAAAVREILVAAGRNVEAMSGLIDGVVALERLGSGDFAVVVEPTDLGALVREHLGDLRGLTANHAMTVQVEGTVRADTDPLRIRQVLTNLLSNATKFAPTGTAIDVSVVGDGQHALVRVTDQGPGIDPQRLPELFGRFSRLGADGRGMGIGLYISRAIARAHGGDLSYERGPDGGASFLLRVPVSVRADVDAEARG